LTPAPAGARLCEPGAEGHAGSHRGASCRSRRAGPESSLPPSSWSSPHVAKDLRARRGSMRRGWTRTSRTPSTSAPTCRARWDANHSASMIPSCRRARSEEPLRARRTVAPGTTRTPPPVLARFLAPTWCAWPLPTESCRWWWPGPSTPDEHVAARQPDGLDTGPVPPSRYTPGRGSSASVDEPRSTTTIADDDADDRPATDASVPCIPVLGP
jgi:hypothetical protein